jgi:hypothetical protein
MASLPNYVLLGAGGAITAGGNNKGVGNQFVREIPKGALDGVNTTFTLSFVPTPQWAIWVVLNGVLQDPYNPAGTPQFTLGTAPSSPPTSPPISDNRTLTFAVAPKATDWLWVIYVKGIAGGSSTGKARRFGIGAVGAPGTASSDGRRVDWLEATMFVNPAVLPLAGSTVQIGSATTYTWVTTLNNAVPFQIKAGPTPFWAIVDAINGNTGSAGYGVYFSTATTPNPDVVASIGPGGILLQVIADAIDGSITLDASGSGMTIQFTLPTAPQVYYTTAVITSGVMADGDTVTISSQTYTFKFGLGFNNAIPNQILIDPLAGPGKDLDTPVRRLADAINGGFGSGTRYSSATAVNADVTATYDPDTENITVTSKAGGAVSVALSTSSGGRFFWSDSQLGGAGGGSGASNDVLDWGSDPRYKIIGDISFSIWIKMFIDSPDGSFMVATQGYDGGGGSGFNDLFALGVNKSGKTFTITYQHEHGAQVSDSHTFPQQFPVGQWHNVGFTRNTSSKIIELFMKSSAGMISLGTFNYSNNPSGGQNAGTHLTVGNSKPGSFLVMNGACQEHYYWSRVLTSGELGDAADGNPPLTALILGCVMGDDPEVDISGNGGSGTVTGTTLVQGHN